MTRVYMLNNRTVDRSKLLPVHSSPVQVVNILTSQSIPHCLSLRTDTRGQNGILPDEEFCLLKETDPSTDRLVSGQWAVWREIRVH